MAWSTWKDMAQQQSHMLHRAHACMLKLQGSLLARAFTTWRAASLRQQDLRWAGHGVYTAY